jgi:hypothetical protein
MSERDAIATVDALEEIGFITRFDDDSYEVHLPPEDNHADELAAVTAAIRGGYSGSRHHGK